MTTKTSQTIPILSDLEKTTFIKSFQAIIDTENSILLEELWDCPKAILLYFLLKTTQKDIIVMIDGDEENRIFQDLAYFAPNTVLEFPAWEAFVGEKVPPSCDVMGQRLQTLRALQKSEEPKIILTPLKSLLQKTVSPETLKSLFISFKKGEDIPFELVTQEIGDLGYTRSKLVSDKGQYAVRGGIIDIFPIASKTPVRIEFFGDVIEQIRLFDPMSQKSSGTVDSVQLSHADEYELLFDEKNLSTLLDYTDDATLVFDDLLKMEDRFASISTMMSTLPKYFLKLEDLLLTKKKKVFWTKHALETLGDVEQTGKGGRNFYSGRSPLEDVSFEICNQTIKTKRCHHPFLPVRDFLNQEDLEDGIEQVHDKNVTMHFLYDELKEQEKITSLQQVPKEHTISKGYLSSGFAIEEAGLVIIPYTEFSNRQKIRRSGWRQSYHTPTSEFHTIEDGDLVVHFHNGIGRYLGVVKQNNHLGIESEFMVIEYAKSSKLYVPVSQSHLVSRYIGTKEDHPQLHQLGTSTWTRSRTKAQQAILGYAKDLLSQQAERELKGGFSYGEDSLDIQQFADAFPYTETNDQLGAIHDISNDLIESTPMDRLICGDVGYGKTEVAMRAAFKAVVDGKKQVAVLVPTTVLALQHYESFKNRMELFGVNIGVASRFQTAKEMKLTLAGVKSGNVDILVGTHRLIGKDVEFKDLGLVIIDEEQRFGVRAKESLKRFKVNVDCLTMTATPIPRTLYMSLVGAKTMSVINSPPQDRLPIRTIIAEKDDDTIKTALLRELSRDGQIYFVHNRVESIQKVADHIQSLAPSAHVAVIHGQMSSDYIDKVIHMFKSGEVDVLVATTIIENGIDIPNANTILIDRADAFGISDLYQLRGRVGRWNKTAYCYFLVPKDRVLPEISQKRLSALVESSGFGGGMKLAMRDLEIRGAGDILGIQQSGHACSIGFHLYCKLLKRAVDALKKKKTMSFVEARLEFTFDAKLPAHYIPDSSLRLEIYNRLGQSLTWGDAQEIMDELTDRFGPPPEQVVWLHHMTRLRIFANQYQFISIQFLQHSIKAERQLGKSCEKKSFFIPPTISPKELEQVTIKRISEEFSLPS